MHPSDSAAATKTTYASMPPRAAPGRRAQPVRPRARRTCCGWRPGAVPAPAGRKARSVVFIFQSGGPSQHETFDPKPDAPDGIRGEYGTTQTRLPGVRFCEYLPRLAARADRFAIVRTMHHPAGREFRNEHSSCTYLLHTGTTGAAAGRHQRQHHRPAAGPVRVAVDRLADRLRRAAGAGVGLPRGDRAAARRT